MKNIKRIQNQLNYISEYARNLSKKGSSESVSELGDEQNLSQDIQEAKDLVDEINLIKLTKNNINRIDLKSLTNSISEGLIIYSMDLEVIYINPALAQMLLPANPKGTGRLILNPDDSLFFERCSEPGLFEKLQRCLTKEPSVPRSDIITLKSPKQVLKRYSSPLYDTDNNQIGHVIIYHDITTETEIEELRTDFISNASHELRTPVTSIKVLLESLMSGAKDEPDLLNEFLSDLSLEVDRLHQLVNDLLDIAKLEAKRDSINISEFSIKDILTECLSTIMPQANNSNVNLSYPDLDESVKIKADKRKLRQVFINLITNAVKFTPSGGKVNIFINNMPDALECKIKDTGIGIPEEDQPHIFDKFYRVNKERSRLIGGSGLGLTIVKQIIDAHNGSIHVKSRPGMTSFTFRIPQF